MGLFFAKRGLLVIAIGLGGCCIEGYVVPSTTTISFSEVPPKVQKAITAGYDADELESVERTLFHSRCATSWERYRFHLKDGQTITLDQDGRLAKWRDGLRKSPAGAGM